MKAVEFTAALGAEPVLIIPREIAAQLPKQGNARVIILMGEDSEEVEWRMASYEQFVREDPPEDSIYDTYR